MTIIIVLIKYGIIRIKYIDDEIKRRIIMTDEKIENKKPSRFSELVTVIFCFIGLFLIGYGIFGLTQVFQVFPLIDWYSILVFLFSIGSIVVGVFINKLFFHIVWNKNNIKRSINNILIVIVLIVILVYGFMYIAFKDI